LPPASAGGIVKSIFATSFRWWNSEAYLYHQLQVVEQ